MGADFRRHTAASGRPFCSVLIQPCARLRAALGPLTAWSEDQLWVGVAGRLQPFRGVGPQPTEPSTCHPTGRAPATGDSPEAKPAPVTELQENPEPEAPACRCAAPCAGSTGSGCAACAGDSVCAWSRPLGRPTMAQEAPLREGACAPESSRLPPMTRPSPGARCQSCGPAFHSLSHRKQK